MPTPSSRPTTPAGWEFGSVATSIAIWITTATATVMPASISLARAAGLNRATPSRYPPAGPGRVSSGLRNAVTREDGA